jgi:hypothetical protein
MRIARFIAKILPALAPMTALARASSFTSSGFVGKWTFKDISGEPFTIWLSDDGTAKGDRSGEGLSGMWKPRDNAAMVTWDCGSVIKITKEGDSYKVHQEEARRDWAQGRGWLGQHPNVMQQSNFLPARTTDLCC